MPKPPDLVNNSPLSVSALNQQVRLCLETTFPLLWVSGEISNLTRAASGHIYFSLKDSAAQVRCVMWRTRAQTLGWQPKNGDQVEARALVAFYEPRGEFQLNVEALRQGGQGQLFERFLRLKATLEAAGLFAPEHKRSLPPYPHKIGIVTSLQAAALRDVLSTLLRRAPQLKIDIFPTPVQGEGAAEQICAALTAAGQSDCALLILCRGGGSIEDLWPFNEESVAHAIAACPVPVISGIGHETDFTIADFVADQRAATPTAAAELAIRERSALLHTLQQQSARLQRASQRRLADWQQRLDRLTDKLAHPAERLARQSEKLAALALRLQRASQFLHEQQRARLLRLTDNLKQLDPLAVLGRGYALVTNEQGQALRNSTQVHIGDSLRIRLAHGQLAAQVSARSEDDRTPRADP
ncbi:exodeoxyribonuclease VII large subunit [Azonexus sp.]|uniref:exodeoxyribonuclease VII large subunit n=1 Tax=Azonexus sp. TaxID=1872668 RepID=UPI0039E675E4